MKDINVSPDVAKKITDLLSEVYDLCEKNNVPMLASVVLKRETKGETQGVEKMLSVHLDGKTGAMDSTLLAASEILRMSRIPTSVIVQLAAIRHAMKSEPCDHPECQAERERRRAHMH
ncbi:TPA: hypothetical protein P5S08_004603 [Salmonella enterica subsp. enterica serovar Concord]|nr:hypothetical protein [Salmonella enterica subsp. enterica serovar Concord]